MVKCQTIFNLIEKFAPKGLAYDWDNVGLQVGCPNAEVEKMLIALDLTDDILDQAVKEKVDLIITHHPIIFKPLKKIALNTSLGARINKILQNNITVYSAHTNLDIAPGGVNDILAEKIGLQETEILAETKKENLFKLVVFVPKGYQGPIQEALANAGAGWIGNYSHCFFETSGTGSFKPLEGTNPFMGKVGVIEQVEEQRLETIVPEKFLKKAISAMLKVHPYEEVAYDIYPLSNQGEKYGLGRIGYLTKELSLSDFIQRVKEALNISQLRIAGYPGQMVKKVAVCGGSGGSLIFSAAFGGAQVLLTADVKYHEAREAEELGLTVIDAGHDISEQIIVPVLLDYLQQELAGKVQIVHSNLEPLFKTI